MIGINKLQVNQATLEEAVQAYLQKEWARTDIKVTGIEAKSSNYGVGPTYEVTIESDPQPEVKSC